MILSKAKPPEPKPKEGDQRITTHFAWWPKKVKEGAIWLERYERVYEYTIKKRFHMMMYLVIDAVLPAWDIIEERRINPCA